MPVRITLGVALVLLIEHPASAPPGQPVDCTFEHASYVGQCVERVTPDDKQKPIHACRAVLACLNDPRCVKSYCNATTLRGGWKLVSPKS